MRRACVALKAKNNEIDGVVVNGVNINSTRIMACTKAKEDWSCLCFMRFLRAGPSQPHIVTATANVFTKLSQFEFFPMYLRGTPIIKVGSATTPWFSADSVPRYHAATQIVML